MWQRLAPIAGPVSKNSALPGRAHVMEDGTGRPPQMLLLTDAEAADWLAAMGAEER